MADKNFKVKTGLSLPQPLPVDQGGTGQTSTTNTLNSLLPSQSGNSAKILSTDGTTLLGLHNQLLIKEEIQQADQHLLQLEIYILIPS